MGFLSLNNIVITMMLMTDGDKTMNESLYLLSFRATALTVNLSMKPRLTDPVGSD